MQIKQSSCVVIFCMFFSIALHAEFIFTKDGSIIQGQILGDTSSTITIRDNTKKVQVITRDKIMRILYTELYMGKVYVQKTDGKNEICYMVDEDRNSYTFRKELYSPVEFTLRRDEVLFMARGNPTGLKGEAGTDSIDLKWFPPYNPVKKYRVFMKSQLDPKFQQIDEIRGTDYTVKKLKSNTRYVFYVSALDDAGDESLPSNQVTVTTKNMKPAAPGNLRTERWEVKLSKKGKSGKTENSKEMKDYLLWDDSMDPDGTITVYRIYLKKSGSTELLSKVKNTEFEIPPGTDIDDIEVRAVDNSGEESGTGIMDSDWGLDVGLRYHYLIPLGKFGDFLVDTTTSEGVSLTVAYNDFILKNLIIGAEVGILGFQNETKDENEEFYFDLIYFQPAVYYSFPVTDNFNIVPGLGCGIAKVSLSGQLFSSDAAWDNKRYSGKDMLIFSGIDLNYKIFSWCSVNAGARYYVIAEKNDRWSFISYSAGLTFMF